MKSKKSKESKKRRIDKMGALKIGSLIVFDVNELAKRFNLHPITIRRYIKKGRLNGQKIGNRWFITEDSFKSFLDSPYYKSPKAKEGQKAEAEEEAKSLQKISLQNRLRELQEEISKLGKSGEKDTALTAEVKALKAKILSDIEKL